MPGFIGADVERPKGSVGRPSYGREIDHSATVVQRSADEQVRLISTGDGPTADVIGPGSSRPRWVWPGDAVATPWFLRAGGGLGVSGPVPMAPIGHEDSGLHWRFPNPFNEYRGVVGTDPIWPIRSGTAVKTTPLGDAPNYAHDLARAFEDGLGDQLRDVVRDFATADLRLAAGVGNVQFAATHPGPAFDAARDAVLYYILEAVSNFSFGRFGK